MISPESVPRYLTAHTTCYHAFFSHPFHRLIPCENPIPTLKLSIGSHVHPTYIPDHVSCFKHPSSRQCLSFLCISPTGRNHPCFCSTNPLTESLPIRYHELSLVKYLARVVEIVFPNLIGTALRHRTRRQEPVYIVAIWAFPGK